MCIFLIESWMKCQIRNLKWEIKKIIWNRKKIENYRLLEKNKYKISIIWNFTGAGARSAKLPTAPPKNGAALPLPLQVWKRSGAPAPAPDFRSGAPERRSKERRSAQLCWILWSEWSNMYALYHKWNLKDFKENI